MGFGRADIDRALETSRHKGAERAADFLVNLSPDLSETLETDDEAAEEAAAAAEEAASAAGACPDAGHYTPSTAKEGPARPLANPALLLAGSGARAMAAKVTSSIKRARAVPAGKGSAAGSGKAVAAPPYSSGHGAFWCSVCNMTFKTPQGP